LSVVKLEKRKGLVLDVSAVDILDGTPVLDLKPYVPYTDRVPEANGGWPELAESPTYRVVFTPTAQTHLAFLGTLGEELHEELRRVLAAGPKQPQYRRIRRVEDGYLIAIRDWRISFQATADVVTVTHLTSGYSESHLAENPSAELDVHREFVTFTGKA
jgi:hypothetical protein